MSLTMWGFRDLNSFVSLNDFVRLPWVSMIRSYVLLSKLDVFLSLFGLFFPVMSKKEIGTAFFSYMRLAMVEFLARDLIYIHFSVFFFGFELEFVVQLLTFQVFYVSPRLEWSNDSEVNLTFLLPIIPIFRSAWDVFAFLFQTHTPLLRGWALWEKFIDAYL